MEAFDGFNDRVQYDIVGHSGETHQIQFVDHKNPPKDAKMRLETIKVCKKEATYIAFELVENSTVHNIFIKFISFLDFR